MKLLFVASEAYPLVKTGGLGDVAYSLPRALHTQGVDVRLLLPAYRGVLEKLRSVKILGWLEVPGANRNVGVRVLQADHPEFPFPLWLADCQSLFDRPGNPYLQSNGQDWGDNAERFSVFSRVAAMLASDPLAVGWKPDVVHAHDWQTGLVPAFQESMPERPQCVFTIHNLAYGGHFSQADFTALQLPSHWWSAEGMEFYGGFSMLKAGIVYADAVTTVSPTYAKEICTPAFGYGMDGLLQSRSGKLHGILNGIDMEVWDPATDPALASWYFPSRIEPGKSLNKRELLKRFGVDNPGSHLQFPLLGMVSRLVEQKGVDLVVNAIPELLADTDARFVLIGAGHAYFEQRLKELAAQYPERVFVFIGYDEQLAHLLEAGADMFLMPSRFEPCGLNQMYSLRYGTPPIVFRTGGLADTVVDASVENMAAGTANGFVFDVPTTRTLVATIRRALDCFAKPAQWQALQARGMSQVFGWENSALQYQMLYRGNH